MLGKFAILIARQGVVHTHLQVSLSVCARVKVGIEPVHHVPVAHPDLKSLGRCEFIMT